MRGHCFSLFCTGFRSIPTQTVTPYRRLLPLVMFGLSQQVMATEALPSLAKGLGQMLFGLAVVVALLLASLWLIKRLSVPRGALSGLRVLGGVSVGSRERLVLVELGDKILLLGVTPNNINALHQLDAIGLSSQTDIADPQSSSSDFASGMKRVLEQRNKAN